MSPKPKDGNSSNSKNNWTQNGVPEMVLGGTILTFSGIDSILQYYDQLQRQEIIKRLQDPDHNHIDHVNHINTTTTITTQIRK